MDKNKIVIVNSSFEQGESLFNWLKKYAKHSDQKFVYWDEFAFTVDFLPECDAILVFNNPSQKIKTNCYLENVVAFMMEPGDRQENPWMFKGLDQYKLVFSPIVQSSNTVQSNGFLGWHVLQDWQTLSALSIPQKTKEISCIASVLRHFHGHRKRFDFINDLQNEMPNVDLFGKGRTFIADKMDGLLPYKYSIAIENTSAPYYFTEKITDCFLAYTVPFYYGCKNILDFFPEKSIVFIDIEKPDLAIKKIRDIVENDDWTLRIDALKEARQLVLDKYQPLAGAASIFRAQKTTYKKEVQLNPIPDRLLRRLKNLLK
jgi:hypothetical protein